MARKLCVFFGLWTVATTGLRAESLEEIRKAARARRYQPPSASECESAEELFRLLASGARSRSRIETLSDSLSLDLTAIESGGETLLVVHESGSPKRGWGVYGFRPRQAAPIALEAPHSYHDLHTGRLVERLWLEGDALAVAFNTAHRHEAAGSGPAGADLAHLPESLLQAFTRAFAQVCPEGLVVQVHGFSRKKRRTAPARNSHVILSTGSRRPHPALSRLARCLGDRLGGRAAIYPTEVGELGGTTNTQGRLLRHGNFLHVELSLTARRRFRDQAELRRWFWRCVVENRP